jgi:uncharacterized repeat protein (TIGR01451 family)
MKVFLTKRSHLVLLLAAAGVGILGIFLIQAPRVFSQESYPAPTGLVAEPGPLNSGYIRLQWQKPGNDAIGYILSQMKAKGGERKRSDIVTEDLIGADSTIFYDTSVSPLVRYNYAVRAVYVGGESVNSASVIGTAPENCPDGCVSVSPLVAGSGTTLVDFGGRKLSLIRFGATTVLGVPIPAGRYQITTYSFDTYEGRSADVNEKNERWYLVFRSADNRIIGQTGLTNDLQDGVKATGKAEVIETEFVLSESADSVTAIHAGFNTGGERVWTPLDEVHAGNIAITDMSVSSDKCLLVVEKEADKTEVSFGDELTYTITVRNDGGVNCTGGGNYIYDYVPEGLEYVSETHTPNVGISRPSGEVYDPATRQLWWVATTPLVSGETAVVTWTGQVVAGAGDSNCDGVGADDLIENRAFVTNTQYAARTIPVRSNTNTITCEPPEEPQIDTTVVPSPNPGYPGEEITWTATPFGECRGPFSYSWTGDDGLTGSSASTSHVYANPGSYYATVTVSAPGCVPITKQSPAPLVIESSAPASFSCFATPNVTQIGRLVTWQAVVSPPNPPRGGSYTFSWSGDENLSGSSQSVTKKYKTSGVKSATVSVGGVDGSPTCSGTVRVQGNPNYQEI